MKIEEKSKKKQAFYLIEFGAVAHSRWNSNPVNVKRLQLTKTTWDKKCLHWLVLLFIIICLLDRFIIQANKCQA